MYGLLKCSSVVYLSVPLVQLDWESPTTRVVPSASLVHASAPPSQAAWHSAFPPAASLSVLIAGLTAPVVARRWHFGISCSRRTNPQSEKSRRFLLY